MASTLSRLRRGATSLTAAEGAVSASTTARGAPALLSCRGVELRYVQVQVLFGVDFEIEQGEIVALLGTNGAGKSSLLRAISGTVAPSGGKVVFDGTDITGTDPASAVARGIVQVPGGRGVFPSLTVGENLRVAAWLQRRDPAHVEAAVERSIALFPVLGARWDQVSGNLSGGEQQMLTLSQALVAKPKLLLIDELSLGLAPAVVQQLLDMVRNIHAEGVTIVLVEQSVNVALSICKRAVFMEKGEVRFSGPTAQLLERPDILRSVFLPGAAAATAADVAVADGGAHPPDAVPAPHVDTPVRRRMDVHALSQLGFRLPVALEAACISKHFGGIRAVNEVSFKLHQGEILGIIGSNGAGKTTVFDLLSGFLSPDTGTVALAGTDVTEWTPAQRAHARLGRSFQDARLFSSLTVAEAIAVAFERHLKVRDPVADALRLGPSLDQEEWVTEKVNALISLLSLEAYAEKYVGELSTGTRRVADIACCLAHEPTVLLLDEPSSGIAQREAEALGPLLLRIQAETGASLLIIEHDIPLLASVSDRLLALELGAVIAEGEPDKVLNDPRVVASYLGTDEATIQRSGALPGERSVTSTPDGAVPAPPGRRGANGATKSGATVSARRRVTPAPARRGATAVAGRPDRPRSTSDPFPEQPRSEK